jgi:hypothetical protein
MGTLLHRLTARIRTEKTSRRGLEMAKDPRDIIVPRENILCPLCGRELKEARAVDGGWECRCGEFVPERLALNPFEGCTHGLNCNCGRGMKR